MSATSLSPPSPKADSVPFVSVIMNCYNGARYLPEALESVLGQTFTEWEIVFWDNRSEDESAAIFRSYTDNRFRYFLSPEHTVLGRARNLAVERARGEWLAFLDCDDAWFPEKLEKQITIIHEEGPELGLVYGRSQLLVEESGLQTRLGRRLQDLQQRNMPKLPEGHIFPDLLKEDFVPLSSSVVRRSAYSAVGGIDPSFKQAEDYDMLLKITRTLKARSLQEAVFSYRIHGSNLSHRQAEDNYLEAIAIASRYLPAPEAKVGLRYLQTSFAADKMQQGYVIEGLKRLQAHGDLFLFIRKSLRFLRRWLFSATKHGAS